MRVFGICDRQVGASAGRRGTEGFGRQRVRAMVPGARKSRIVPATWDLLVICARFGDIISLQLAV